MKKSVVNIVRAAMFVDVSGFPADVFDWDEPGIAISVFASQSNLAGLYNETKPETLICRARP
jgi:hypothetical protein